MALSSSDLLILALVIAGAAVFLFRDSLFASKPSSSSPQTNGSTNGVAKAQPGDGEIQNERDFVEKMKATKKRLVIFYGSQTGTAEEYAIRLAKEAKSRFGLACLVCDPEEYDFETLDQVSDDCAVVWVMATYGEGEPTDNAVPLMEFLGEAGTEAPSFSKSDEAEDPSKPLNGIKYVVFALGNRTYEHFNAVGRKLNARLTELGAKRIGTLGEGDDDKSMEEDYLEWKDGMFEALAAELGVEEGGSGDSADFAVQELGISADAPESSKKVYLGELSARALLGTKGVHDAKNPYPAPLKVTRELFTNEADRNCIHIELDISNSGITYQHGDHVGVWPVNPDAEVERILCALGLGSPERRHTVITVESLDPALAKVPFPAPTTYDTLFRHYLDISAMASRQTLAILSKYAPNQEAQDKLARIGTNKEHYAAVVGQGSLRLGEVLQLVAGDWDRDASSVRAPTVQNTTAWAIPFDQIISSVPRLQPRFYSISSSPKLHPSSIHVTAVVLKWEAQTHTSPSVSKLVYGLGTNYLLNLKTAMHSEGPQAEIPKYALDGPRGLYTRDQIWRAPIHVRRSTFRLPTSPKIPVIMIGPGTGIAPFRGFIQERVALATRALEKNGPNALDDWAPMHLFYGCRHHAQDYLYSEEWPEYIDKLKGKLQFHVAFSRDPSANKEIPTGTGRGGKVYVQDLVWSNRQELATAILEKKGYVYICGDAKGMAKSVEDALSRMLGEAKGGSAEVEGVKEMKVLKERNRLLLDVWS